MHFSGSFASHGNVDSDGKSKFFSRVVYEDTYCSSFVHLTKTSLDATLDVCELKTFIRSFSSIPTWIPSVVELISILQWVFHWSTLVLSDLSIYLLQSNKLGCAAYSSLTLFC